MTGAGKQGLWVFGGPFSGKTTAARAFPELCKEFDAEYESYVAEKGLDVDRRAWRKEHPQHEAFTAIANAVLSLLAAHVKGGGIALSHHPSSDKSLKTVMLRPSRLEIKKRLADWRAKKGDEHRVQALSSWEKRALDCDYALTYDVVDNALLDRILAGYAKRRTT